MHRKELGDVGELTVALDLKKRGYPVFQELGDNSRVDLIALVNNKPVKIQVKSITEKNGSISVTTKKSGPGYSYQYTSDDVDIFAVFVPNQNVILYLSFTTLIGSRKGMTLRFKAPKNNQMSKVNYYTNYLDFDSLVK